MSNFSVSPKFFSESAPSFLRIPFWKVFDGWTVVEAELSVSPSYCHWSVTLQRGSETTCSVVEVCRGGEYRIESVTSMTIESCPADEADELNDELAEWYALKCRQQHAEICKAEMLRCIDDRDEEEIAEDRRLEARAVEVAELMEC